MEKESRDEKVKKILKVALKYHLKQFNSIMYN